MSILTTLLFTFLILSEYLISSFIFPRSNSLKCSKTSLSILKLNVDKSATESQILKFVEPTTNVEILLVGAMHYNPASIELTKSTVDKLANDDKLGVVIIESCPIRWDKTLEFQKEGSLWRTLLNNEMQTAYDAAIKYNAPVILGDQLINVTNSRMGDALKLTFLDMTFGWKTGGWKRLYLEVKDAIEKAVPFGSSYLGLSDFLDWKLLLSTPISLIRYPLALLIKSPVVGLLFMAFSIASIAIADGTIDLPTFQSLSQNVGNTVDNKLDLFQQLIEGITTATVVSLEMIFFSRVFLVTILHERNVVLAENILNECKKQQLLNNKKSVVAVLGMAHCNGIKKLLTKE